MSVRVRVVRVDEDRTPDSEPRAPYGRSARHQVSTGLILPTALVLATLLIVVPRLLGALLSLSIGVLLVVRLARAAFLVLVVVVRIGPILGHGDVLFGGYRRSAGS